ncbi:methyltransferase [Archangium violaceum Cb vi76]|uniref:Methyltransferase n=1 Tax=Archangium violaceum Cb vi76 TaxID=1406225 RepID=A0A084SF33_9BACT|nr:methyltransferase [Archangium violaceum Cb vi76]
MQPGEALFVHPGLKIRPCEWGYGVFTDVAIAEGTILEEAHYLKVPFRTVRSSALSDYVFNIEWGPHEEDRGGEWVAIVMGSGMIYNHSQDPNVSYYRGYQKGHSPKDVFTFYALRDIEAGEQLCISYGENWWKTRGQDMP